MRMQGAGFSRVLICGLFLLRLGLGSLSAQSPPETFNLRNGLPVLYVQDTSRPLLELALVSRGGARIDVKGKDGIAALWSQSFWERGEDSLQYRRYCARYGIRTSARLGLSHVQFGQRMLPQRLEKGLDLLRFALEDASYPGGDLDRARARFALRLDQEDLDPPTFLRRQLNRLLWQDRYPEMDPSGSYADLASLQPRDYREVHQIYLHPSNVLLTATGPLPAADFVQAADSLLGTWENYGPPPAPPYTGMPDLQVPAYEVYLNELTEVPRLRLVWPLDGAFLDGDISRMADWFVALANSRQGPFFRGLIRAGRASSFRWTYTPTRGPGQLRLDLVPNLDSLEASLRAVVAGLNDLTDAEKWPSDVELAGLGMSMDWVRQQDDPQDLLFYLGQQWAVGASTQIAHWERSPEQAELSDFLNRYLIQRPHVGGLLLSSRMARGRDIEDVFQPYGYEGLVAAVEDPPVLEKDTVVAPVPVTLPDWLTDIRIYFQASSFSPDSLSLAVLKRTSEWLLGSDSLRLFLNGYTDGQGDGVYNYKLSISRATEVKDIMVNRFGIPEERLIVQGYGEAFPEYPDDTQAHRALNRRVSFELVPPDFVPNDF